MCEQWWMLLSLQKCSRSSGVGCGCNIELMKQMEGVERVMKGLVDLTGAEEIGVPVAVDLIKMPELALVMAKYFTSLGKYCLSFYNGYREEEGRRVRKSRARREGSGELPPKKPVTAYICYYQEKVPVFQERYPDYTISELTRLIAKEWSELPEETKQPFHHRAAQDRKRYERESQEFKARNGREAEGGEQKKEEELEQVAEGPAEEESESASVVKGEQGCESQREGV